MKISAKSRYAVNAMLNLALQAKEGPVALAYLCESQDVSFSYLEQLFAKLREKELVQGLRGPGGGYTLARDQDEITIGEIMCAVDQQIECNPHKMAKRSTEGQHGTSLDAWDDLSHQLFSFLSGISLGDLVRRGEILADGMEDGALRPAHVGVTKQAA